MRHVHVALFPLKTRSIGAREEWDRRVTTPADLLGRITIRREGDGPREIFRFDALDLLRRAVVASSSSSSLGVSIFFQSYPRSN